MLITLTPETPQEKLDYQNKAVSIPSVGVLALLFRTNDSHVGSLTALPGSVYHGPLDQLYHGVVDAQVHLLSQIMQAHVQRSVDDRLAILTADAKLEMADKDRRNGLRIATE